MPFEAQQEGRSGGRLGGPGSAAGEHQALAALIEWPSTKIVGNGEALSLPVGTHRSDDDDVVQAQERLVVKVGEFDLCRTARPVAVVVE